MTNNTIELLNAILENDNLEEAVLTASAIIFDYLKQHGSKKKLLGICQIVTILTNISLVSLEADDTVPAISSLPR